MSYINNGGVWRFASKPYMSFLAFLWMTCLSSESQVLMYTFIQAFIAFISCSCSESYSSLLFLSCDSNSFPTIFSMLLKQYATLFQSTVIFSSETSIWMPFNKEGLQRVHKKQIQCKTACALKKISHQCAYLSICFIMRFLKCSYYTKMINMESPNGKDFCFFSVVSCFTQCDLLMAKKSFKQWGWGGRWKGNPCAMKLYHKKQVNKQIILITSHFVDLKKCKRPVFQILVLWAPGTESLKMATYHFLDLTMPHIHVYWKKHKIEETNQTFVEIPEKFNNICFETKQPKGASVVAQWFKSWLATWASCIGAPVQGPTVLRLIQVLASGRLPKCLGSCHTLGRPSWDPQLLTLTWSSLCCCYQLESEPADGRYLVSLTACWICKEIYFLKRKIMGHMNIIKRIMTIA